jgi:Cu2+-exporting ATPase
MNRALAEKPLLAQRADHIAHWFVLIILVLSAVVYGAWSVVNPEHALLATLAVLVATCPCALSLATPVALTTATNQLAQQGFLITRGHVLETLSQASHIIFDKTGTLTEGKLELAHIKVFAELDELAVKTIAAALEQYSEHPVAQAFKRLKLSDLPLVGETTNRVGSGLTGIIDGKCYLIGHDLFALGQEADVPADGFLRIWLSCDKQPLASFDLRDKVRTDAVSLIQQLKKQGLTTVLLSGDRSQSPQLLGQTLAIDDIQGGLSPTDKAQYVQHLQEQGAIVVMVGDGINDAPVLGQSHLSVAMASGADLAQTTADAILLSDKLAPLVRARELATKTQTIVKQNLYWAFVYNLVILPPAALGYIPPWVAAIGMSLSSLFVVLNALRLKRTN